MLAQIPDSTKSQHKMQQEQKKFIDENGDGIPDTPQHRGKGEMRRDTFVDKNGDGICDSREQGLGFQRMRKQQSEQMGKQNRRGKK